MSNTVTLPGAMAMDQYQVAAQANGRNRSAYCKLHQTPTWRLYLYRSRLRKLPEQGINRLCWAAAGKPRRHTPQRRKHMSNLTMRPHPRHVKQMLSTSK
jgi:hypothetical protein